MSLRVAYVVKHTYIHIMATFSTRIRLAHMHTNVYTGISVVILSSHLSMAVEFLITQISKYVLSNSIAATNTIYPISSDSGPGITIFNNVNSRL